MIDASTNPAIEVEIFGRPYHFDVKTWIWTRTPSPDEPPHIRYLSDRILDRLNHEDSKYDVYGPLPTYIHVETMLRSAAGTDDWKITFIPPEPFPEELT